MRIRYEAIAERLEDICKELECSWECTDKTLCLHYASYFGAGAALAWVLGEDRFDVFEERF